MIISENKTSFHDCFRVIGEHVTDYQFPPHMHGECEYLYMQNGECVLHVNFETVTLKKGEAFFIVPWVLHSINGLKNSDMHIITFSQEAISFLSEHIDIDNFLSKPYIPNGTLNEYIISEMSDRKCGSMMTLSACANLICLDFLKNNPQPDMNSDKKSDSSIALAAAKYIRAHYREELTLSKVAQVVGTSASYLSRILNSKSDLGFARYLDELRISHAQMLLRTTDMKISDIAAQSGYTNIRTFNRKFREHFYKSPSDMRKNEKLESLENIRKI